MYSLSLSKTAYTQPYLTPRSLNTSLFIRSNRGKKHYFNLRLIIFSVQIGVPSGLAGIDVSSILKTSDYCFTWKAQARLIQKRAETGSLKHMGVPHL